MHGRVLRLTKPPCSSERATRGLRWSPSDLVDVARSEVVGGSKLGLGVKANSLVTVGYGRCGHCLFVVERDVLTLGAGGECADTSMHAVGM